MASRVLDFAQKVVVTGLIGGTGFLLYTNVNQAMTLVERRKRFEAELKELEERGEVPEGASEGKVKGFRYEKKKNKCN